MIFWLKVSCISFRNKNVASNLGFCSVVLFHAAMINRYADITNKIRPGNGEEEGATAKQNPRDWGFKNVLSTFCKHIF